MDEKQLNKLGELVDTAENYLALVGNEYLTMAMKVDALNNGITKLRDSIKALYLELGGENVWVDAV